VYVPNTAVFNGTVVNVSSRTAQDFEIVLRTAAAGDPTRAREDVLASVAAVSGVLAEPVPSVSVSASNPDRVRFEIHAWVDPRVADLDAVKASALMAVRSALE
jgi:small-conductance mechanosensitive channel